MLRGLRFLFCGSVIAAAVGCGDDGTMPGDSGPAGDTGRDLGTTSDGGPRDTGNDDDTGSGRDLGPMDSGPGDTGSTDAGSDSVPCDSTIMPINGAAGGPLAGKLTIFVRDSFLAPNPGVTVMVVAGGARLIGAVSTQGCVQFEDAALTGPVAIHFFGPMIDPLSYAGVNAKVFGVLLDPRGANLPIEEATVTGTVTGLEVLGSTTATVASFAVAVQFAPDLFRTLPTQAARANEPNVNRNVAVLGGPGAFSFHDYESRVTADTTAMAAIGGKLRFPGVGQPAQELTHFGALTGISLTRDQVLAGQDIALTLPLTSSVTLTWGSTPSGLAQFLALTWVHLPNSAGVLVLGSTNVRPASPRAGFAGFPALSGPLAQATYGGGAQVTNGSGSFSFILEPGTAGRTLALGDLPELPTGITTSARTANVTLDSTTDSYAVVSALNAAGVAVWVGVIVNPSSSLSIVFPVPPAGITDPLSAATQINVFAAATDVVDLNDAVDINLLAFIRRGSGRVQPASF